MDCVKLTNGTRERPALYVGLYRGVAKHLFGEAASDHELFRAATRRRLYVAVGLIDKRLVMHRVKSISDEVARGWVIAEVRPVGSASRGIPDASSTVCNFTILENQLPGLIIEGRLGIQPNPKKFGAMQTLRNPRVAVHGRNEFDHPVRLSEGMSFSSHEASFDVPPNWLHENGSESTFQPPLPLAPTPREEELSAAVSDAISAPQPIAAPEPSRAEATPEHYTVRVPPNMIQAMLLEAVRVGRSIVIDKSTGWIEID